MNKPLLYISLGIILIIIISANSGNNLTDNKFIYGICIHPGHYDTSASNQQPRSLQALKDLGVSMVREDVQWSTVEAQKGFYDFTTTDRRIDILRGIGVDTLPILTYGNKYYANVPPGTYWQTDRYTPPMGTPEWEAYKVAFSKFIYASVKHLSDKYNMTYYEIWNEPYGFWEPSTESYETRAIKYTELMKMAYPEAKRANPNSQILIGGLGVSKELTITYTEVMYRYGIKNYFDIMNVHPYINYNNYSEDPKVVGYSGGVIEHMDYLKQIMNSYGDNDKRWWVTEMGYPTDGCYISRVISPLDGSRVNTVMSCGQQLNETNQAIRVTNFFRRLNDDFPYVDAVFWYDFRDDCMFNSRLPPGCTANAINATCPVHTECRFGLVNYSFGYKPGFYAYQDVIKAGG